MTILCDIDNVLNNFSFSLLEKLNVRDGTNYDYEDISHYGWFEEHFENPWEPTQDMFFWDFTYYYTDALSTLQDFVKQGHKVYLVTASHFSDTLGYKINTLLDLVDNNLINEKNIIVAQDKTIIKGDVLIDDCYENIRDFCRAGGNCILFTQPWNRRYTWPWKTNDWNKIKNIINSATPRK